MDLRRTLRTDADLYRRGEWITALARGLSFAFGLLALALLWTSPRTRPLPAALVGVVWLAFSLTAHFVKRRRPKARRLLKITHDVVDAVAVGLAAAFSGGMESPV